MVTSIQLHSPIKLNNSLVSVLNNDTEKSFSHPLLYLQLLGNFFNKRY